MVYLDNLKKLRPNKLIKSQIKTNKLKPLKQKPSRTKNGIIPAIVINEYIIEHWNIPTGQKLLLPIVKNQDENITIT